MPVYEYRCLTCQYRFEKLGPISSRDDRAECPGCGSPGAERVPSTFAAFAMSGGQASSLGGCCGGAGGSCACRG